MSESTAFRQMDEKHVSVDVHLMLWSPKFDLVALSNVQGEVISVVSFCKQNKSESYKM